MKEFIKKIWNDSVWSDVISSCIYALIVIIITKLLNDYNIIDITKVYERIPKISAIYIIIVPVSGWVLFRLYKKIFKKEKAQYNPKQLKLMEFNEVSYANIGLTYRWSVRFDNEKPIIADFTSYCTKHGILPIRFMHNRCPVRDCEYSFQAPDINQAANVIESAVIDYWKNLNN